MQEEDEKSRASVNTNSYAAPIETNVVSTENTENNIHPLLKPYCKPANIVISDGSVRQIQTLRDTGAMQSLLKTHITVMISLPLTKPHCLKASRHRHKECH